MHEACLNLELEICTRLCRQLQLTASLLEIAKVEGDLVWRAGLIGIAQEAYVHAVSVLDRIPRLPVERRALVVERMASTCSLLTSVETLLRQDLPESAAGPAGAGSAISVRQPV